MVGDVATESSTDGSSRGVRPTAIISVECEYRYIDKV